VAFLFQLITRSAYLDSPVNNHAGKYLNANFAQHGAVDNGEFTLLNNPSAWRGRRNINASSQEIVSSRVFFGSPFTSFHAVCQ
jgi:hypothetical protein